MTASPDLSGGEESPNTAGQDARKGRREATESATENIPPRFAGVRVKRWGKSPPLRVVTPGGTVNPVRCKAK